MTSTETTPTVNKQLFENSGLKELFAQQGHKAGETYFNPQEPNLAILHERPEHRLAIWLRARGHSNNEIAEQLGYTVPWVSQILRQPWAQALLVQAQNELGAEGLRELIQQEGTRSLVKLVKLRDDAKLGESVAGKKLQVEVSRYLVDRYLGKPKESMEVVNVKDPKEMTKEELEAAIAREEARQRPSRIDLASEVDHPSQESETPNALQSLSS